MRETGLDLLAFPANSDIGPWNADTDPVAARLAWADGCVFSSTNHVVRRVGIPTVTLPMGLMDDTAMPVGLTLAGRARDDVRLLGIAAAVEAVLPPRPEAPLPAVDRRNRPGLLTDLDPTGMLRHALVNTVVF
jgi:amidase